MWTPLYITLPKPQGLESFVEALAVIMGGAEVEWRESSNYVEGRYANLRSKEVFYRVCIADESVPELRDCDFQVDVDADNRLSEQAVADWYAGEVAKKFAASGWKVIQYTTRGESNPELKRFR